jgi:hypothetical protein
MGQEIFRKFVRKSQVYILVSQCWECSCSVHTARRADWCKEAARVYSKFGYNSSRLRGDLANGRAY